MQRSATQTLEFLPDSEKQEEAHEKKERKKKNEEENKVQTADQKGRSREKESTVAFAPHPLLHAGNR